LFLGVFQLVHAYVARDVLYHAAARAARAKTVGFNAWMVKKTMRVAAIPTAGALLVPTVTSGNTGLSDALNSMGPGALWDYVLQSTPRAASLDLELARIPEYLASQNSDRAANILDGDLTYGITRPLIDEVLLLEEPFLERAVALYCNVEKTVAEGAGAAPLAAAMKLAKERPDFIKGKQIGLTLCGGNVDHDLFARVLNG
jgi:hypothetical protein